MSLLLPHYKKYTERIDECLHIRNNPEKAELICSLLRTILNHYSGLIYDAEYFRGYYNNFYLTIKDYCYECQVEKLIADSKLYFDEETQKQFQILANILDRLKLIHKTEDDNDFKEKVSSFISEVQEQLFLKDEQIVEYQYKAKKILDDYNYSNTSAKTVVVEKLSKNKGCLVALVFLIPVLIINYIKFKKNA